MPHGHSVRDKAATTYARMLRELPPGLNEWAVHRLGVPSRPPLNHTETVTRLLVVVVLAAAAFTAGALAHSSGTDTHLCPFPVEVELLRSGIPHAETAVLEFTLEGP